MGSPVRRVRHLHHRRVLHQLFLSRPRREAAVQQCHHAQRRPGASELREQVHRACLTSVAKLAPKCQKATGPGVVYGPVPIMTARLCGGSSTSRNTMEMLDRR